MTRVAAIQMTSNNDVQHNLKMAEELLKEAKQQGAHFAVLPEMFAIMTADETKKLAVQEEYGHGPIQDFLAETAAKLGIWIVGGTIPLKSNQPERSKAACLIFDQNGKQVGRYDKMHLFDVLIQKQIEEYRESDTVAAGEHITVLDSPFGKLGIAVCYDIRFPELFRSMVNRGAEIFVLPAAFTMKTGAAHWEILSRARAIENFCYFVGACQVGKHPGARETYGHSLIIHPWGTIQAQILESKPGVIVSEIDLPGLRKIREDMPVIQHQKIICK